MSVSFTLRKIDPPTDAVRALFLDTLERIGIECVSKAREAGNYGNVTGNLRSSIGFCILEDGKLYRKSTPQVVAGKKGTGTVGVGVHDEIISSLQRDYNTGIYLFVFAGMKYAKYVQAMGFDVLKASETLLNTLLTNV